MIRISIAAASLLLSVGTAQAACENSFAKKGNPVTGLRFTASVQVATCRAPARWGN